MADFTLSHKMIDNYKYHKSFPDTWIDEEGLNNIGPRYCYNCKCYGNIDDIFIGYCLNCANHILKGKRGSGMSGNEIINESNDFDFTKCPYMSLLERIELKKMIFNKNIERVKIVPPILSRSFASDLINTDSGEYDVLFRHDEIHPWSSNYGWEDYDDCEYSDRPDSIS